MDQNYLIGGGYILYTHKKGNQLAGAAFIDSVVNAIELQTTSGFLGIHA